MEIEGILSKLNEEQIKPVLDTEGAVLVIAGAGSGKTRVLVSRILYLIKEKGVNPYNIMAITFTNKAADEMRERLAPYVDNISSMWVSTIHSMCVKILRRDIYKLGYTKDFTIYDETDKDKVLKRICEDKNIDVEKYLKIVKNIISNAKNDCISPLEFKNENSDFIMVNEIFTIYDEYDRVLAKSNALDFDDLLYKTYILFENFPDVADYYANRFQYVLIDEFQDTNKVQFAIAQRLCLKHGNIFVVGDDDQSIYSWRGAKIENILNFDDIYRGAKIYKLQQNYRSTKKILELANCIIKNNVHRRTKELWTSNNDGEKVELYNASDENNEASYVAIQIKRLISNGYNYKDFAVFMRINALTRPFEQEFAKYGIPFKVFGGFRFFERKEIKDALSYLKLISNPRDNESFLRAISSPKRGIGDKTLQELREFSASRSLSMLEGIDIIDFCDINKSAKGKLIVFRDLINSFKKFAGDNSISDLIKKIFVDTSFLDQFVDKTEENMARKMNLSELINSAEDFCKDNPNTTLSDYLNSVTLSSDTDDINEQNCVTLATIHSVKGLEYPVVFIVGLDEKVLPIIRNDEDDIEEERRLMYVAVTRAKQKLFLTRASSRFLYGNRDRTYPSRFLTEAKSILNYNFNSNNSYSNTSFRTKNNSNYTYKNQYNNDESDFQKSSSNYSSNYAKTLLNDNKTKVVNNNTSEYKIGCKVKHAKFGEGTIIAVNGTADNIIVDVAFKGIGIKKMSPKYAPMEIING